MPAIFVKGFERQRIVRPMAQTVDGPDDPTTTVKDPKEKAK